MAKEIISESRLREIISEEAARFKKKLTLESEKKKLLKRLDEMYAEEKEMDSENIEEAWWNIEQGGEDRFMKDLNVKMVALKRLGGSITDQEKNQIIDLAKKDKFGGTLQVTQKGPQGKLIYVNSKEAKAGGSSVTSIAR